MTTSDPPPLEEAVPPAIPDEGKATTEPTKRPKRVIRRRRRQAVDETPPLDPILLKKVLEQSNLPTAYSFEIEKTVQRIQKLKATHVALQMPEGLLLYATVLGDVLKRLVGNSLQEVSILGDVTYGACCVDDLGAQALGADLLVHYGHSCLVPLQHTAVPCLYVFVEIAVDTQHVVDCLHATLQQLQQQEQPHIYLLGTIQFRHALQEAKALLTVQGYNSVSIPQAKPLSPGEVLGCTSPVLNHHSGPAVVLFLADGRFHLESTLISNPTVPAYRYDPYGKSLTIESYQHDQMKTLRLQAIQKAKQANSFGVILGTLGRQGNPAIVQRMTSALRRHGKTSFVLLLSEITPAKLACFSSVDAWVQVACPRLSVDWGHALSTKPVLSPYECMVCLGETEWQSTYPMDYYRNDDENAPTGPWTNYFEQNKQRSFINTVQEQQQLVSAHFVLSANAWVSLGVVDYYRLDDIFHTRATKTDWPSLYPLRTN